MGVALSTVFAAPATAFPTFWGNSYASGYGSSALGKGEWTNPQPLAYHNSAQVLFSNADNHEVYVKLRGWEDVGQCSKNPGHEECRVDPMNLVSDTETGRTDTVGRWVSLDGQIDLDPRGTVARLSSQVKIDIPARYDISGDEFKTDSFQL